MTIRDAEVLEALRDEPELLAIADAVVATPAHRRWRWAVPAAAAAAVVAVLALLVTAPWGGHGLQLSDRALAAIGTKPILHAVFLQTREGGRVELATGRTVPVRSMAEIWVDEGRGLSRFVLRRDGQVIRRGTARLQGGWATLGSPLGLAAMFRQALEDGRLHQTGTGTVRGHKVIWAEYRARDMEQVVALDASTYVPLVMEYRRGRGTGLRVDVLQMETLPRGSVRFGRPSSDEGVSTGSGVIRVAPPRTPSRPSASDLARARTALGRPALWVGRQIAGRGLAAVEVTTIETTSGDRRASADVVRLLYGGTRVLPFLELEEYDARAAGPLWRMDDAVAPPPGYVDLDKELVGSSPGHERGRWLGRLQAQGLWMTIESWSRSALLDTARHLRPIR